MRWPLRWLQAVLLPLAEISGSTGLSAARRLSQWSDTLRELIRRRVLDDPELFRVHHHIVGQAPEILDGHVAVIRSQVARIIASDMAEGAFSQELDADKAAWSFLQAHFPVPSSGADFTSGRVLDEDATAVLGLLPGGWFCLVIRASFEPLSELAPLA